MAAKSPVTISPENGVFASNETTLILVKEWEKMNLLSNLTKSLQQPFVIYFRYKKELRYVV